MEFQEIYQALGQSLNYEDWLGDFTRARQAADQWLAGIDAGASLEERVDALTWSAIVHILSGELNRAEEALDEAESLAGGDNNRVLRIQTYRLLAMYERFNTYPDGGGAASVEVSARWRGTPDLQGPNNRWELLRASADNQDMQFESWYVYGFLCNLKPVRYMLESTRYAPASFDKNFFLDSNTATATRLSQQARAAGVISTEIFAAWCAADLHRRAGNGQAAVETLQHALVRATESGYLPGQGLCLMSLADWRAAPFSMPIAWNFALQESSSETSSLAASVEKLEFAAPNKEDVAAASDLYRQAEQAFHESGHKRGVAAVRLRCGYLAMLDDDFNRAADLAESANSIFRECGDLKAAHLALTHLIMAKLGQGQRAGLAGPAASIGQWGASSGNFSYAVGLGVILNRFARHLVLRKGNYEGAIAAYQAARRLHEALQAPINAAQNTADLAVVAQSAGDRTAALTYYEEALDRYLKVIEHYPEQFPGGNDIVSNIRQRILMLATNAYQLSLQKLDSDGMERYAARLRDQVSELPDFQGEPADLLSMLSRQMGGLLSGKGSEAAIEIEAGVEFWSLRQMAQSAIEQAAVLAPLYRSRRLKKDGQIEDAAQQWKQALSALETMSPGTRDMFEAVVWSEIKENEKAADAYRRFLEQGGADAGFTGILTQLMEQVGGSHGQAERRLQDRRTHQNAFTMWVRLDNFEEARQHLEALENLDGPEWWRQESQPWQYLSDCAEMYDGFGNPEKALEYFDKAIEMLEARRALLSRDELKTALAADKGAMYLYFLAARTAVKVKQYALAFSFTEKAKARALLDLVAGSLSMAGASDLESSAMRRWRQLNAELSLQRGLMAQERSKSRPDEIRIEELSAKIENGESALHELEEELLESNPDFFNAVNAEAPTLTLEAVAELLPDDACLIEYFFQGEEMLVWAVDHKGLKQVWPLKVDEGELERTVKALHQACERRRPLEEEAGRLAEMLLGPMLEYLRDYRRLYIVPHGALHTLPFHVLPFEGLPLAGRFEIAYLPSAGALQFLKPAAISGKDEVLVIGNPTLDLQSAYAEAAYVAALFGQEPLLGDAATEQAVVDRIGRARLVHFATHGRLSEEAPLLSSIALASDEELSLYELMGLQLSADLVVLSACNTARGETTGGDDVLGLTRGLFSAGAKAAIVTLWEVNDLSTSLFMGEFYRRLKAGGSPAWSLRQAQDFLRNLQPEEIQRELEKLEQGLAPGAARDAVKRGRATRDLAGDEAFAYEEPVDYSHPFYWAPFVLVGRL